ncbi:MerR family transcriptional regulator [Gottschalkiaceae bacterium SANA]|nr:MerR family transcriptional regulator [Gottschalkiaceae bacterium SANA]
MKKMTIGEYAKLRNVTTETLRHYDRIDLFHPIERDGNSKYRYYSIEQDEKLGTIRELQQLGMSTDEIKNYFNNRNLAQSFDLLLKVQMQLQERIQTLQKLEDNLASRIDHLDQIIHHTDFESIEIKNYDQRLLLRKNTYCTTDDEYHYTSLELEKALNEPTPLLANNRLGFMRNPNETNVEHSFPFIFINHENSADPKYIHSVPAGQYACKFYKGDYRNFVKEVTGMTKILIKQGYAVIGHTLEIVQVDISVTDILEESIFQIQIPIKKA